MWTTYQSPGPPNGSSAFGSSGSGGFADSATSRGFGLGTARARGSRRLGAPRVRLGGVRATSSVAAVDGSSPSPCIDSISRYACSSGAGVAAVVGGGLVVSGVGVGRGGVVVGSTSSVTGSVPSGRDGQLPITSKMRRWNT